MSLFARSHRQRGQSLAEYALIIAVMAVAAIAVLGMASPAAFDGLGSVTTALRGESGEPSSGFRLPVPAWVAIGALVVGALSVYLAKIRRG